MSLVALYFALLKGTATSFAGLASLAVIRDALVVHHRVLTDQALTDAVVITRSTPGPVGLYVVSVGYFVAGIPGAVVGWLAMATPALLVIPLVALVGKRFEHPRVKSVLRCVVLASAGLLLATAIPLGREALTDLFSVVIAAAALVALLRTKIEVAWVILGAAALSSLAAGAGLIRALL